MAVTKQFTTWRNVNLVPLSLPVDDVKISLLHSSTLVSRRSSIDPGFSFLVEEVEDLIVRLYIGSGQPLALYGVKKHLTGKRSLQQMVGIYNVIPKPPPKRRKIQQNMQDIQLNDLASECSLHSQLNSRGIVKLYHAEKLKSKDDQSIFSSRDIVTLSAAKGLKPEGDCSIFSSRDIVPLSPANGLKPEGDRSLFSSRDIVTLSPAKVLKPEGDRSLLSSRDVVKITPAKEMKLEGDLQSMLSRRDTVKVFPAAELKSEDVLNSLTSRDIVKVFPAKEMKSEDVLSLLTSRNTVKLTSAKEGGSQSMLNRRAIADPQNILNNQDSIRIPQNRQQRMSNACVSINADDVNLENESIEHKVSLKLKYPQGTDFEAIPIKPAIDKFVDNALTHTQLNGSYVMKTELDLLSATKGISRTIRNDKSKLEELETVESDSEQTEPEPLKREITNNGSLVMVTLIYSEVNAGQTNMKPAISQPAKEKLLYSNTICTRTEICKNAEKDNEKVEFTSHPVQKAGSLTNTSHGPNSNNLTSFQTDIPKRLILKPVVKKYIPGIGNKAEQLNSAIVSADCKDMPVNQSMSLKRKVIRESSLPDQSDTVEQIAISETDTQPKSARKRKWLPDQLSYPQKYVSSDSNVMSGYGNAKQQRDVNAKVVSNDMSNTHLKSEEKPEIPRPKKRINNIHPSMNWVNPNILANQRQPVDEKSVSAERGKLSEKNLERNSPEKHTSREVVKPIAQKSTTKVHPIMQWINPNKLADKQVMTGSKSLKRENSQYTEVVPSKYQKITSPESDTKYGRQHASTFSLPNGRKQLKKPNVGTTSQNKSNVEPAVKKPFKFVKITYP